MVVLAFGLLYVAVVAEERQMQEATKTPQTLEGLLADLLLRGASNHLAR